jgi:hypothetical protein
MLRKTIVFTKAGGIRSGIFGTVRGLIGSAFHFNNIMFFKLMDKPNAIQEEIKSRLQPGIAFCHLVQNILCSGLLYKNLKIKIYRTVILGVVLYGCEVWSLTLREERRLRVFENRVLRRVFGPKRDEVTGEWKKLHNEELNDLYCSPNIVRVIKWVRIGLAEHVARLGVEKRCI